MYAQSVQVKAVFEACGRAYGSRRVSAGLKGQEHRIGRHTLPVAANVLDRQFMPTPPNQAWVSDITYIRIRSGWL